MTAAKCFPLHAKFQYICIMKKLPPVLWYISNKIYPAGCLLCDTTQPQ